MRALQAGANLKQAARLEGPIVPLEGGEKLEFVKRKDAFEAWLKADSQWEKEVKMKKKASERFNKQDEAAQLFQVRWYFDESIEAQLASAGAFLLGPCYADTRGIPMLTQSTLKHTIP